ncbi:MAG: hypothetical protein WBO97_09315, partial [Tepidiformaceae bacterium]
FVWRERRDAVIEAHLTEIVTAVLASVELERRAQELRQHEDRVRLKAEMLQHHQRLLEESREAGRAHLIAQAESFRQAEQIRQFVAAMTPAHEIERSPEFLKWRDWALSEAQRLDPLKDRQFDWSVPAGGITA